MTEKKKGGFGKGVLVGVLSTLGVVLVVAAIAVGIFWALPSRRASLSGENQVATSQDGAAGQGDDAGAGSGNGGADAGSGNGGTGSGNDEVGSGSGNGDADADAESGNGDAESADADAGSGSGDAGSGNGEADGSGILAGDGDMQITEMLKQLIDVDMIEELTNITSCLEEDYLYDVDTEALKTGMLEGLVEALGDPYSEYYDEAELTSFMDSTNGSYVGIGAAVTQELDTGYVKISNPYGAPCKEAGLQAGDYIVSVDGVEVTGMDLNEVVNLIKGEEGTSVNLTIYRDGEEDYRYVTIVRQAVEQPTVASEMLEQQIGYIQVSGFEGVTAEQFEQAYEDLEAQGMERVIVDLRNNGGGLVDAVEEMLDYLLPEGVIFYAKDKNGQKFEAYQSDASAALDIPMAVLVNGDTASASEVFSGNIQAFGMGTIVGTTTYGKGVMQSLYYTNEEGTAGVKLTTADYYIYTDKNINGSGITPDVVVELDDSAIVDGALVRERDNQLQAAIDAVLSWQ